MAFEFRLPDVGEGLHEADITKWLVKEGDSVREDQPLVEVQTDKVSVELTSPVTGKIEKLFGKEGETIHVGSVIVVFDVGDGVPAAAAAPPAPAGAPPAEGADVPATKAPAATAAQAAAAVAAPAPTAPAPAAAERVGRALATPSTRRVAREMGVDINLVMGTGPAGRVTEADVRSFASGAQPAAAPATAAAAPAAAPAAPPALPGDRIPLKGIRKTISERMVASKHTAAHVTVVDEVDLSDVVKVREQAKPLAGARGIKLTFLPFVVKALVAALKEFPYLNASIDDAKGEIVLHKAYNIGIAVDTDNGLVVPVVKDADKKSIFTIAQEIATLAEKAHAGKLSLDEIKGGTCSISNMGSVGGLMFTPIINHPEVAILGVGKLQDRPVVRDGQVVVRKMQYLSLSFDHRLVDGALATRFLSRVIEYLGNPTLLLMEMV